MIAQSVIFWRNSDAEVLLTGWDVTLVIVAVVLVPAIVRVVRLLRRRQETKGGRT